MPADADASARAPRDMESRLHWLPARGFSEHRRHDSLLPRRPGRRGDSTGGLPRPRRAAEACGRDARLPTAAGGELHTLAVAGGGEFRFESLVLPIGGDAEAKAAEAQRTMGQCSRDGLR
jgi:hypothetical protein